MELHQSLWDVPEEEVIVRWEEHAKQVVRQTVLDTRREFGNTAAALSALRSRIPAALAEAEAAAEALGRAKAQRSIGAQPGAVAPRRRPRLSKIGKTAARSAPPAARGNPRGRR